jgi:hypothetical protein
MRNLSRAGLVVASLASVTVGAAWGGETVQLQERFAPGYQYRVRSRVELTGSLTPEPVKGKVTPRPLDVQGESAIDYDERVLDVAADGQVRKTVRLVARMDFRRTVGGRPQQTSMRPAVARLVLLRRGTTEVPFSPDGPLTWGEIDLVRTDVFTPALAGLLPGRPVSLGDRWPASVPAIAELTDMEHIEGGLECRLEQVTTLEGRRHARVAFTGTVRGTTEDGPARQQLDGYFFFDLESGHLSYLHLDGRHALLDKDGREVGQVKGRFVLSRQVLSGIPGLTDEALRGVALEPDAGNTLLLYDNPDLGLRFLHPRRWRVAGVRGTQVTLDSADGSGLVITPDGPRRVPTGEQFLAESRTWLQGQKARLLRTEPVRRIRFDPPLEHFALGVELGGQKFLMDYFVARQGAGGATVAARLLPADQDNLRKEVERIALSLEFRPK